MFYLGTEAQWKATSYNVWAEIGCRFVDERLRPNKQLEPAPVRGTQ
jgi:hypothetical protein